MDLKEKLISIAEQIRVQQQWMTTEQATINVSIHPFIRALGYDTNNLAEVRPEFTADAKSSGSERVDYAIIRDGAPIFFIEAKAANVVLNENHWKQLHHYYNAEEVRFGVLTNGLEFQFFTDLKKRNIMDNRPFLTIDMLSLDEQLVKELEPFTRTGYDAARIIANAKTQRIVQLLKDEMVRPSAGIVKYFAGQVHSGNVNAKIVQEFTPLVKAAWKRFIEFESGSHLQYYDSSDSINTPPAPVHDAKAKQGATVSISHESDMIPVYAHYEGEDFTANFVVKHGYKKRSDNVISYNGSWHSVSALAKELKTKIHNRLNLKKVAETNGWTDFWYYKDAKTKEGPIDDFRKNPELVDRYRGRT